MILAAALAGVLGTQDVDLLLERLDDEDPALRAEAAAALRGLGEAAIPALERALGHSSPEVRGRADELLLRFPHYALRGILRLPEYGEVRRLWTAVVEAVIWKRPIPADLGRELLRGMHGLEELRELQRRRHHSGLEILAGLREAAWAALRDQLMEIGIADTQVEVDDRRQQFSPPDVDFLPLVRRAEPDEASFEEIYGTLGLLQLGKGFCGMEDWSPDDWALAVRVLVQIRRRPGTPALGALATREEILELACRGPIVQGIADALGRAFANRELNKIEKALRQEQEEAETSDDVRRIYGVLLQMDRWIAGTYYHPGLLDAVRPTLPATLATVPAPRRDFFDRVNAGNDAARRVVADLLSQPGDPPWNPRDDETAVRLLRAVASRVAAAAQ